MLAAALYGYAAALTPPRDHITEAERISFLFMSTFTILPPVLIESVLRGMGFSLRRPKWRIALWIFLCLLAVAARLLAHYAPRLELYVQASDRMPKEEEDKRRNLYPQNNTSLARFHRTRDYHANLTGLLAHN